MDDPIITGATILNAIAVWFLLKAAELAVFIIYDVFFALHRFATSRNTRNAEIRYDRKRGLLEFIYSGGGFLNFSLWCKRKQWLLLISTLLPLLVFVLVIMSIIVGKNTSQCITSNDPNVVQAPALVLFGEGERHVNLNRLFSETARPLSLIRPCVSWSSTDREVEYLASICAEDGAAEHGFLVEELNLKGKIRVSLFKKIIPGYEFAILVQVVREAPVLFETDVNESTRLVATVIGAHKFTSDVIVNGKSVLLQNASITDISEKAQSQLIADFRTLEAFAKLKPGEYFEDEASFGFLWEDRYTYSAGSAALILAVLAQSTREARFIVGGNSTLYIKFPNTSFTFSGTHVVSSPLGRQRRSTKSIQVFASE